MLKEEPRCVDLVAQGSLQVLELPQSCYDTLEPLLQTKLLLAMPPYCNGQRRREFFQEFAYTSQLSEDDLWLMGSCFVPKECEAGQTVVKEGSAPHNIVLIVQGQVNK